MLRIALVLEDGDRLHLMMGTPRGWLADGKKIEVERAPTYFGNVNYAARSSIESGTITISVSPPTRKQAEVILHIRPPTKYGSIKSVTVNGELWKNFTADSVNLGKITSEVSVICHF